MKPNSANITASTQQNKWLLSGLIICLAVAAAAYLEFTAASDKHLGGYVSTWALISVVLLNVLSSFARRLLTRSRGRLFLLGQVPFAIGITKLVALLVMAILTVALVGGLVFGVPDRDVALSAFVSGLVVTAAALIAANGLLNLIIVVRHYRGTLATTTRPSRT